MSDSTRRGFLKYAGAGVAAAGAAAVVPAAILKAERTSDVALPKGASGSLMAHVGDLHSGEVAVMVEGHEVTVVDHQLVARLAQVLHTAKQSAAHPTDPSARA